VEGRGQFYDQTGALRDWCKAICSNSCASLRWSLPASSDPDAVRDEKLKCLGRYAPFWIGRSDQDRSCALQGGRCKRARYRGISTSGCPC